MKKYKVIVNGTAYEVELEEMTGAVASAPAAPAKAAVSAAPAGGEKVTSPMPGTILSVNCAQGDTVKRGQILFILEAMKMENEIMCPVDGKVTSMTVTKGSAVETGTVLCTIE